MALVITIDNPYELKRRFEEANRDYFSICACEALIDEFEQYGENIELDIIAICCDYTEAEPQEIFEEYENLEDIADCMDEDGELDEDALLDALNYHTYATKLNNGCILYVNF